MDVTEGVYIDSVIAQSAADKAGIKAGDVITQIDGRISPSPLNCRKWLPVIVRVMKFLWLSTGTEKEWIAQQHCKPLKEQQKWLPKKEAKYNRCLAAELKAVERDEAQKLNIDGGVKVTKLYPGKLRSETEVREGFIITSINTKPVNTVEEVSNILQKTTGGVMLEGIYENDTTKHYYAFGM